MSRYRDPQLQMHENHSDLQNRSQVFSNVAGPFSKGALESGDKCIRQVLNSIQRRKC